jgi:hypothetical protein
LKIPGIHVKNAVFWVILEHKALPNFPWLKLREHNFVSIKFIFFEKKDLGIFILSYYDKNG